MHNRFLSDLHSILENTKPNTAEYDSAVTDLADTVYTSYDYEDVLARMERLFIHDLDYQLHPNTPHIHPYMYG